MTFHRETIFRAQKESEARSPKSIKINHSKVFSLGGHQEQRGKGGRRI
jgi:hypothetical protein